MFDPNMSLPVRSAVNQTITCWGWGSATFGTPDGRYLDVATQGDGTCAITLEGAITCWGFGDFGQDRAPEGKYIDVSAGHYHSCAIGTDRTITCWGRYTSHQTDDYEYSQAPEGEYTQVSAGNQHTCALATDQTISCWGYRFFQWMDSFDREGEYEQIGVGR